jgi:hypothetical protein
LVCRKANAEQNKSILDQVLVKSPKLGRDRKLGWDKDCGK